MPKRLTVSPTRERRSSLMVGFGFPACRRPPSRVDGNLALRVFPPDEPGYHEGHIVADLASCGLFRPLDLELDQLRRILRPFPAAHPGVPVYLVCPAGGQIDR